MSWAMRTVGAMRRKAASVTTPCGWLWWSSSASWPRLSPASASSSWTSSSLSRSDNPLEIFTSTSAFECQLNKIWKKKQKLSEQFRSREPSLTVQPGSSDPSPSSSPTPPRHPHNGGSPRRPGMAFLEIPGASASSSLGSANSPRRGSKIMKGIYSSIREFRLRFQKLIFFSFKVCVNSLGSASVNQCLI